MEKLVIKMLKKDGSYFVNLHIGDMEYKNLLVDTGSSYLSLKGYKPGEKSHPISDKKYDIYTVYGGQKLTINECATKNDDDNSIESCGILKLYDDVVHGMNVTVCDVIHGSAFDILGLTCLAHDEKSTNNSFVRWNNRIKNLTIDFKGDVIIFNDPDTDFKFIKRHHIKGYFTDFYAIKDSSPQFGDIIMAFDTGATTTFIPKNIAKGKPQTFDITNLDIHIPRYNTLDIELNFIFLGIDSMTKFSKFYFSKDYVGYRK